MKNWIVVIESGKSWMVLFTSALVLGTAWTFVSIADEASTTSSHIASPRVGFLAPDFTLSTLDGDEVTLSDLQGNPVVLNLWASWCPPCRAEMPAIQKIYEQNLDRGLQVLAVNMTYQDSPNAARSFVREFDLSFPVPLDETGEVGKGYLMRALPSTFFIDREGIIQTVIIGGPMSETTLQSAIEALFEGDS
jgi:cytochrome c biogenesis protein CcmG/thiol:disulfide interchange protein DsbE